ncbi:N-acetylmuramoyl-L-alanine amidase family protein [Bacillus wiedmannii]|uniref:N-acetylmuramoyl-L-alanine amidase family protein n=1 Tax=Bacillus wiedmannii TaxID=1890302 RepID=UPI000BEFF143|nr:N-acetylmuramoyl-L-alanine amidase [Bacillus wiedmannii]PEJ48422.1 N-acetylmuramoyl-L-alanine amidase [Bacillus wiedmannii]PEM10292.1 N-acetylmuramoyl-L-alanine amidase [Bacillus wiedmannii]PGD08255.1 N-acetylmuramoyl-L-alanine amidase [Bacillus wiedmannii]PHD09596.1 N-acetylmuramoyl-L-alanine amidase [Bacillus wiedmannii]
MVKIMLDAGHGGHDSGAVGNGLREKDIVLKIALKTQEILVNRFNNVEVHLTRYDDTFVTLSGRAAYANQKGVDAFVSIHCNSGGGYGFESFRQTGVNDARTVGFQNAIHKHLSAVFANNVSPYRDRGMKQNDLAVLRQTNMIAVLTENLFMDNVEITKFNSESIVTKVAEAHAEGIAEFFGLSRKQGGSTGGGTKYPIIGRTTANLWTHIGANIEVSTRKQLLPMGTDWQIWGEVNGMYAVGGDEYASKDYMKIIG